MALGNNKIQRIKAYREIFGQVLTNEEIARIRLSLEKEHALGTERFRIEMKRLTGIRQRSAKPGPKPKKTNAKERDNLTLEF